MLILPLALIVTLLTPAVALAAPDIDAHHNEELAGTKDIPPFTAHISAKGELHVGQPTAMLLTLTRTATEEPVAPEEVKIVHTQRVHLLVVDPSLTDYQHLHPTPGAKGEWNFTFTPKKEGSYRIWADVASAASGRHDYLKMDIGTPAKNVPVVDTSVNTVAMVGDYRFTLSFEEPPVAGKAVMGTVTVTDQQGNPVTTLQPVMGAFAHIVGFGEDYNSIMHVHPLGKEPTNNSERGGPQLEFHFEPDKAGFVKLFVQTKINGTDIFAPFGTMVK